TGLNSFTVQVDATGGSDTATLEITVNDVTDTTPPAAPSGLSATAGDASVTLDWADNGEGDLAGYSVFRSTTSGSYGAALATGLTASDFVDSTVVNETTYYYVVTATDTSTNESAQSTEVSAMPTVLETSQLWGVNGETWDPTSSVLKDFTDVGYMNGDTAIPDWPVGVNVTNFGAIANDGIDDSQAFIDAIAACPSNHAVFVPNGQYQITDQIRVERDYVVLRGEDMYQTVLFFPRNIGERYPLPSFDESYSHSGFFRADGGTHKSIENLTMEFRRQTKMGHWEHRYPNAINYVGDVEDSWIRNIYFKNVDAAVTFNGATRISVLNLILGQSIERPDFIGSSGIVRWVGHVGVGMGNLSKSLMHNIEFKGKYFHEFDIINVPSYNVISSVKGTDMALHNHGQGANHNLYTEIYAGTGTRIFGALTDTQRVHHETYWNIDADNLIDPASFTNCTGSNVFVGVHADYATEIRDDFYYESIDPDVLTPSNIYLAQMEKVGKLDNLYLTPPPAPPIVPELAGDVRILNPTDDISDSTGNPEGQTLSFSGYMKFDLSELQDLSTITKARVRICTSARKAGSGSFNLRTYSVADDSWTQDNITADPAVGSMLDSVTIEDEVRWKWWEMTSPPLFRMSGPATRRFLSILTSTGPVPSSGV
ncbi:MAG TPA: glycosyl hydrolase family 28-related protein, partial [Tichowtungia sp.]|nr:glycosyl hydrolase family 28-related protein [Tichowtungia sp.]